MKVQIITAFVPLAVLITETVCLQGYGPRAAASRSKTCGCGCGGGCADSGMGRGAGGGGKNALGGGNASYLDFQQGAVDEIVIINDQEIPLLAGEYLGEPDEIVFERIVRVDEYGNEEIQIVKDEIYDIGNDNGNSPLIRYGAGNAVGNDVGVELAIEMPTQNGANIQEMIDPNGNVTITGSNGNGRIMESIDPYGNVNITESNGNQQITETIDPYGNITIAENNGNERLLETIDPYGNINITESNGGQQIMETIDPYGNINITESNGGQQIMEAIDPYGNINITENIGNERIVETIDPYGNINITESINGVEMIAERISPNGDITIIEDTVLPIVTLQDNPALASYFNELPATARTNVASPQQSINWLALAEQQTQFTPRQIINNAAEQLQYNVLASVPQAGATSYRSLPVEQVPVIVASDCGSPITTGIIRSYPGVNYVQSFLNGAVFEGTAYWYSNYLTSIGSCGYSPSTLQYGAFLIGLPLALMPEGCSQGICGSNLSPLCGLCAVVTNSAGKSIVARIVDTANTETYNIILSEPAFAQLAPVDQGMVKVSYQVAQCPVF